MIAQGLPNLGGALAGTYAAPAAGTLYTQALTASLTTSAAVPRTNARTLAASLVASGTALLRILRALAAGVTASGTTRKASSRRVGASLAAAAANSERTGRAVGAATTVSAGMATSQALQRAVAAGVTAETATTRIQAASHALSAAVGSAAAITYRGARGVGAVVAGLRSLMYMALATRGAQVELSGARQVRIAPTSHSAVVGVSAGSVGRSALSAALNASTLIAARTVSRRDQLLVRTMTVSRSLLTTLIAVVAGWSQQLYPSITLTSRYTPDVHLKSTP